MNLFYTDGRLAGAVDGAHFVWEAAKGGSGKVGLRLTSYNLALYLTAILAVYRVDPRTRLGWGVAGFPSCSYDRLAILCWGWRVSG